MTFCINKWYVFSLGILPNFQDRKKNQECIYSHSTENKAF